MVSDVYHGSEKHAEKVNVYINARHPQPAVSVLSVEAAKNPSFGFVHPEWKAALDQYHEELDRLREDWALEVCGRHMQIMIYFYHQRDPYGRLRTMPLTLRHTAIPIREYWQWRIRKRMLPLWWGSLRRHYRARLLSIHKKYHHFLGIRFVLGCDLDKYVSAWSFLVVGKTTLPMYRRPLTRM